MRPSISVASELDGHKAEETWQRGAKSLTQISRMYECSSDRRVSKSPRSTKAPSSHACFRLAVIGESYWAQDYGSVSRAATRRIPNRPGPSVIKQSRLGTAKFRSSWQGHCDEWCAPATYILEFIATALEIAASPWSLLDLLRWRYTRNAPLGQEISLVMGMINGRCWTPCD